MKNKIITRMAPSPTGLFHIGSARTALFNYLFAKNNHGKFILRFEDTDKVRSKKKYEKDILEGLKWLELNHDGKIFYQTSDLKKYLKYAEKLLKENKAYKKDGAIWFKLDSCDKNVIAYNDLIMGKIEFKKSVFHDFVIIKKDGVPTFMFGNAIEDYEMKISHVIRGTEHINSTPQQIMIYESLNLPVPQFAHIPLILNQDRSKMSKRKDPVSVTRNFRDQGYLPEAMINYIALLGWNPKDNRDFFTLKELVKEFDLKNVNKSGAVFDIEKLNYFNNYYLRQLSIGKILATISKLKIFRQHPLLTIDTEKAEKIISIHITRIGPLSDLKLIKDYYFKLPRLNTELLIFRKSNKDSTLKGLKLSLEALSDASDVKWSKILPINQLLLDVVQNNNLTNGDVFWPVRVALSGLEKSPSPTELLWVLGKEESLKRIKLAINKIERLK